MKFLEIACTMGLIGPDDAKTILLQQRRNRRVGIPSRVGEIAVAAGFLKTGDIDPILTRQVELRPFAPPETAESGFSFRSVQMLVGAFATIAFVLMVWRLQWHAQDAASLLSFGSWAMLTILEYFEDRRLFLSLYRAFKPTASVAGILVCIYATVKSGVSTIQDLRWIVIGLFGFVLLFLAYAMWKAHSLRIAESRTGILKDMLIRAEADCTRPGETPAVRHARAIRTVLAGLRSVVELSPWDRLIRRFFPASCVTTAYLMMKEEGEHRFRIHEIAIAERSQDDVRRAFHWVRDHHFPASFNEQEFQKLVKLAKGANEKGWEYRFRNFKERADCVSVCGWISNRQKSMICRDASKCNVIDNGYLQALREQGYSAAQLQWLEIGSYMGCPVPGCHGSEGVLLVTKNLRNGLNPEDLEALILVSHIMGQVIRATREGK